MAVYLVWIALVWHVFPEFSGAVCENEINELRSLVNQQAVMIKNIQEDSKHSRAEIDLLKTKIKQMEMGQSPNMKDTLDKQTFDKRLLAGSTEGLDNIAFYAYMSANEALQKHKTLVFDFTKLNIGNGYNNITGAFTVAKHGLYIFTLTLHSNQYSLAGVQLLVNNEVQGSIFTDSSEGWETNASSVTIPVWANQGAVVYIRTHSTHVLTGSLLSNDYHRCSFAGWKV